MRILHLLSGGGLGGIEVLCKDIACESKNKNEFAFLFSGGKIADELDRERQCIYRLYNKKGRICRIVYLLSLIRKQQYDVIVAHHDSLSMYLFYLFIRAVFPTKIYIKYLHSAFDESFCYKNNMLYNLLIRWSLRCIFNVSDHIVAVSNDVKTSFTKYFSYNSKQIEVVYNGIPLKPYSFSKQQKHRHTLLYIGRLEKEKGLSVLLKAANIMAKEDHFNFKVIIVGSGSYREELERQIIAENLDNKVFLEEETLDKEKYYSQSDIFLYPSVCREAFGISIVEAMWYGLLCVASDTGGIPELVEHGTNGFLFRTRDEQALKECLYQIFSMKQEEQNIVCAQAVATAESFSIQHTVEQLEKLYEKCS